MNDIKLANALGWCSLVLGTVQLIASRRVARTLGLSKPDVVWALGARDVAAGLSVLAYPDNQNSLWARAAGDAMDLTVLAGALCRGNHRRGNAALAAGAVLGLTVLDVLCASSLARRRHRALETARRTRVRSAS